MQTSIQPKTKQLFVILVIALILVFSFNVRPFMRLLFPVYYEQLIIENAQAHNLDPFLVAALIKAESNFSPTAVSPKGAIGLLQLMPSTGQWVARQSGMGDIEEEDLFSPELNIYLGTWYLQRLLKHYDGNEALSLAAYNAGRGNVGRWLADETWAGEVSRLQDVPFPETRGFVRKVLRLRRLYQYIYQDSWKR